MHFGATPARVRRCSSNVTDTAHCDSGSQTHSLYHGRGKYNSREKYSARAFRGKLQNIKTSFLAN
jgi:hypothetical protein